MPKIQTCRMPADALLCRYEREGAFTDCYFADVASTVTHVEFVEAFYCTAVFKLERLLLAWFVGRPSTDMQARELAEGRRDAFAAWHVEARALSQILLCDFQGSTRSWLMSSAAPDGASTRLYFGSAVVPRVDRRSGKLAMSRVFRALLGFHKLYSSVLLKAAVVRLRHSR